MGTVGVYDYDFMNYRNVIPNLECAKICTYYHNKHEIAVLAPELVPERYSTFYVRKEYDDGIFPKEIFSKNCIYSGRAFNPKRYAPLPLDIEKTIPNMHIYDSFIARYGNSEPEIIQIKKILDCAHIRLSLDGIHSKSFNQVSNILNIQRYRGIIFHDYDLGQVSNAYDIIEELSNTRTYKTRAGIHPYLIGNKFPIQISDSKQLEKWLKIHTMPDAFFIQYNGFIENETLIDLCQKNKNIAKQIFYNVSDCYKTEEEFLNLFAEKIFKQVLFLRRSGNKILLVHDEKKELPVEANNFLVLLNSWLRISWGEEVKDFPQSLFNFCKMYKKDKYTSFAYRNIKISIKDIRNCFQYFRIKKYDLFKEFYEVQEVRNEGGEFVYVR